MSKRGDREFVLDMLIACCKILRYVEDMSFEKFLEDEKTKDAVALNIEILGEAVKNISEALRRKHGNIEWSEIAKTRDKLIHSYFGIDDEILWDIATIDIPKLKEKLEKLIEKEGWDFET